MTLLGVPSGATISWAVGGVEAVAEGGLTNPAIVLHLRPEITELLSAPPAPATALIRATVTLDGVSRSAETTVSVLPLRVPSLLALFRNRAFSSADYGAALLVAPANSPLASVRGVRSAIEQLHAATERLSVFGDFAVLSRRVAALLAALRTHEHMTFKCADSVADLGTITMIPRGVLANDITAEDEMSSAILLGPAGRDARLFIHRDFEESGGRLDVVVGDEHIVLLEDLGSTESVPHGRARVVTTPRRRSTFDDDVSSVQFARRP